MKVVACLTLLASVVHAGLLRRRQVCPQVCDASQCFDLAPACDYGQVKDECGCCVVCAAGEGQVCGDGSSTSLPCGDGLRCDSVLGTDGSLHSACVCTSSGPVCGSDGRTYPSICRLRAENSRAQSSGTPPLIFIQRGHCDSGIDPGRLRFKFNFIADVVEKIMPAVVHLELFQREAFSNKEVSASSGSGFVVSEDGWIITNAHLLNNKHRIKVELKSGLQYDATQKYTDEKMDIALIKIEPVTPLPVLHLGQSSDLRTGEFVVAVGSPFSLQNTVTVGIISAAKRNSLELGFKDSNMDYIQTDAIFNYGNSGGPLVNLDGDVIGINTLKVAAGISFAIPVDRIRQFLAESYTKQINGHAPQKKKFIGVRMLQLLPPFIRDLKERFPGQLPDVSSGVYIYEVMPGTPAARAGMISGDVITSISGRPVRTTHQVSEAVQSGAELSVVVRRKDGDVTLSIIPEETN